MNTPNENEKRADNSDALALIAAWKKSLDNWIDSGHARVPVAFRPMVEEIERVELSL